MIGGYLLEHYQKAAKMKEKANLSVTVEGMTCSHCESTVQNNLLKLKGISKVFANNNTNTVQISGQAIDLKKVEEVVNGLGYKYKGQNSG